MEENKTAETKTNETGKIFAESMKTAGETIKTKIVKPILQQAAYDITSKIVSAIGASITGTLDCLIFGKDNMGKHEIPVNNNRVGYSQCYGTPQPQNMGEPARKSSIEFDSIPFQSKEDAQIVIDTLNDIIARYNKVSVLDYYDIAHVTCPQASYSKYGWRSITSATIVPLRNGNGYTIMFPEAKLL